MGRRRRKLGTGALAQGLGEANDADGLLPRRVVAWVAAVLYWVCGALVLVASPLLPLAPGSSLVAMAAVGVAALVLGCVVAALPWHRWGPRATLWLVPAAFTMVAAYNVATNGDGMRYSLFFMVIFVWLGVSHAPGWSLRFAPLAVVAYVAPLLVVEAVGSDVASVAYAVPTFVLGGETVSWVAQRAMRSERRFRSLVQHATDVITVVGADGTVAYDSPAVERVLGYHPDDRIGSPATSYVHPEDLPTLHHAVDEVTAGEAQVAHIEVRVPHADGSFRWCSAVLQDLRHDPAVGGFTANFRDITAEREAEQLLRHRATHDELTGLANRSLCVSHLDEVLAAPGRRPVSVLLLDLDRFKLVNDSLGHRTGDLLIGAVARRLRSCVAIGQLVGRLGGDEFVIVLDDTDEDDAVHTAATILAALGQPFALAGNEVTVSTSIGIAVGTGEGASADDLLRDADAAMYVAKRSGGRAWRVFEPGMHTAAVQALETEWRLRQAITRRQFELHYQPLVDLRAGTVRGAEALIRWRHPEQGLLAPGAFIPTAEDTGLIVEIGRWVLEEACGQLARWHAEHDASLDISVNLSGRQLGETSLVRSVEQTIAHAGIRPDRVVLEITESQAVQDTELAAQRLQELKELGVRIAIDDFGTGHSSLAYLRTFPVDILKLDRSFVRDVGTDARGTQLVEAILGLGRALHLQTVAEGIETAEQQRRLQALGCHLGQGYHLGRPVPAAEFSLGPLTTAG